MSENYISEFGEPQLPKEITNKNKKLVTHKHHIIPKHAGGSDDSSNLIELTIEQHADAHKKLYEEYGRWQDRVAWGVLSKRIGRDDLYREFAKIGAKACLDQGKNSFVNGYGKIAGKIGGKIGGPRGAATLMRLKIGIHGLTHEQRVANGKIYGKLNPGNPRGKTNGKLNKGRLFYTDGKETIRLYSHQEVPRGFKRGQHYKISSNTFWVTNGVVEFKIKNNELLPENFRMGRKFSTTIGKRGKNKNV